MPKIKGTCEECGKVIEFYPSQHKRFCSASCRSTHVGREQWAKPGVKPRRPRTGDTIPCDVCGTPFYRTQNEIARNRRYCSVTCHNLAQTKTPVVKHCPTCGKEMRLKPSQAGRVYCSNACMGAGMTKRPLTRTHNGKPARIDDKGYVMVWEPEHPNKTMKGWQYEHRLVAEAAVGRYLRSDEAVHHVNGVKDDNRPENLEVMDALDHATLSVRDVWAQIERDRAELAEYRRRYGPLSKED